MVSSSDYITGERLQELADITILTDPIARFHHNLADRPVRVCRFPGSMTDLGVEKGPLPRALRDAEVIFVYTHLAGAFFQKILPRLENPFILMTHNSDHGVDARFIPFLEDSRILRWYAQNLEADHEKLVSLPLGAANSQWPHGRLDLLHEAASRRPSRTGLVYMNFDPRTNPAQRQPVLDALRGHPLVTESSGLDYGAYLGELAAHHFAVCPPGNGLDCHRIWECLYLGVIPLVSARFRLCGFDDLPILYVEEWGRIDAEFLRESYERLARQPICLDAIRLDHWRRALAADRSRLRRQRREKEAV